MAAQNELIDPLEGLGYGDNFNWNVLNWDDLLQINMNHHNFVDRSFNDGQNFPIANHNISTTMTVS